MKGNDAEDVQDQPVEDDCFSEAMNEEAKAASQIFHSETPHSETPHSETGPDAAAILVSDAGYQYYLLWTKGFVEDGAVAWRCRKD